MLTCTDTPIKMFSSYFWLASLILAFILWINGANSFSTATKIGKGYRLISIEENPDGSIVGHLQVKQKNNIYGPDIPLLQLFVKHETQHRLRVHITDADKQRWEVPYNLIPREQPPASKLTTGRSSKNSIAVKEYSGSELIFSYIEDPFTFAVRRKSNGLTLFNSSSEDSDPFSQLVFKDQYLEISTKLPEDASLYGLGENTQPHGIKLHPGDPYTLYTTDKSAVKTNIDLYGSHPVYMDLRDVNGRGYAHSVLLLNSNGMDVFYRGTSLTYKIIGGVLDFYFLSGPTPLSAVDQYTDLIGRPAPMPYWAFGFHQCRWGYPNLSVVEDVVENYKKAQIPLDVIWTDDDHMDGHKDFTLSPINFPRPKLLAFVQKLHNIGMKYVVIIDPGISVNSTYGVYQRGIANDVFIKYHGKPYMGQVWPGAVHFPDFLNPKTVQWWGSEIRRFHELFPVDGLWIDMNEVSNFCSGLCTIPKTRQCPIARDATCCLDCTNITDTKWDDPPYKINASGQQVPIGYKTIATSAVHYNGVLEYDAHSLYGFSQAIATNKALQALEGKRPFVLSRSTYVGSGKYAAHWTGDNRATWEDLKYSISTVLNFGTFGVPMVGADICGFYPISFLPSKFGPLEVSQKSAIDGFEELCNRWIEVGAFYPFSRDHSSFLSPRQELYQWESVAISARNALGMRYKLLSYLYTLNYEAHVSGAPIARPLFFSFPNFPECYGLSTQFLLGSGLMISPVLDEGQSQVKALFPSGSWYNIFNMTQTFTSKSGQYVTLEAPLHVINVHLYQNTIVPMQQGGLVSKEARMTPFTLVVTFPAGATYAKAKGNLFLDDDELPEMKLRSGSSTYIEFYAKASHGTVKVWSKVNEGEFALQKGWIVEKLTVLGLKGSGKPYALEINGKSILEASNSRISSSEHTEVEKDNKSVMVEVKDLNVPVGKDFAVSWKMG